MDAQQAVTQTADAVNQAAQHVAQAAHTMDPFIASFTIFVLAIFVGYHVVWNVTPALHTPLMAVTNAVSGIIVVGAMLQVVYINGETLTLTSVLGALAVFLASINIFGGFMVTQRMLEMFKKKK
ncbi:proton-translocating transhydrogenase family protein [Chitinivorax sp. B]|uniref:proton-translocating transhydrogenase family protein n=1 Tax=Chitinivorax sp. B TaxID=2502235 RepID=UPI0014851598|nr:proton-translocating transhydrogenase family protein [Chitinivorax sp. B]